MIRDRVMASASIFHCYVCIAFAGWALMVIASCPSHSARESNSTPSQSTIQGKPVIEEPSRKNSPCPVSVKLLSVSPGKPPSKLYSFTLELWNRETEPIWFLFRHIGDRALSVSDRFEGYSYEKQPFSSMLYTSNELGKKSKAVVIEFLGEVSFKAVRLPKESNIKFDNFGFGAFSDVGEFEVWEVRSLLVNGKTPVEQWLPYPVLSDQFAHFAKAKLTSLDWDSTIHNYRQDYPNEKVEFVTAHAIKKCAVPLK